MRRRCFLCIRNSARDGYDNAAAILADRNGFAGTGIVRFGRTDDETLDRERFAGISAFARLTGGLDMYRKHYQYGKAEGARRRLRDLVPGSAFREAMANALMHRLWDFPANVQVDGDGRPSKPRATPASRASSGIPRPRASMGEATRTSGTTWSARFQMRT